MQKLTYIFFAISLLLFSCKAMDFATIQDEDNCVTIQYYNLKPVSQTLVNFLMLQDTYNVAFNEKKDTLVLDFTIRKEEDIKIKSPREGAILIISCGPRLSKLVNYYKTNKRVEYFVQPDDFYQVYFPILEVENVEHKDVGKWYRSFSTIVVNVEKTVSVEQFIFTNPRFLFSASNYTRP